MIEDEEHLNLNLPAPVCVGSCNKVILTFDLGLVSLATDGALMPLLGLALGGRCGEHFTYNWLLHLWDSGDELLRFTDLETKV